MKKIIVLTQRVYDWLKKRPAYQFIPLLLLVQFVTTFVLSISGLIDMADKGEASLFDETSFGMIFFVCVFVPLLETVIFQRAPIEITLLVNKFLPTRKHIEMRVLKVSAFILSATLFGLMHTYSPSYVVFGCIMGATCALGYIVSRDKKGKKYAYWIVACMHALWNTTGVISSILP